MVIPFALTVSEPLLLQKRNYLEIASSIQVQQLARIIKYLLE